MSSIAVSLRRAKVKFPGHKKETDSRKLWKTHTSRLSKSDSLSIEKNLDMSICDMVFPLTILGIEIAPLWQDVYNMESIQIQLNCDYEFRELNCISIPVGYNFS
jgi:hypothetical protein